MSAKTKLKAQAFPFLIGAFSLLALGVLGGLARLGFAPLEIPASVIQHHGALMVSGFLGTLISLERASAMGGALPLAAPGLKAIGGYLFVFGQPGAGASVWIAGDLALAGIILRFLLQDRELHTLTLLLGAVSLLIGDLGVNPSSAWIGFLVLTIFGERLELSRVRWISSRARLAFAGAVLILMLGIVSQPRWLGLGLLATSSWMLINDLAMRTVRLTGLPRFMALCLILGNAWLALSGILLLGSGTIGGGFVADAVLHSALLGFVFSMIFAHGPIIFPALTGARLPYRRVFYVHVALLHISLLLRVAGDITADSSLRGFGGMLNALAILAFTLSTLGSALSAAKGR